MSHHRARIRGLMFVAAATVTSALLGSHASALGDVHWVTPRTTSTDWNTASNWNVGAVPTADDDVFLSVIAPPAVTLSADAVARSLTVFDGDQLDTTGHRLDVTGGIRIIGNGLLVGANSTVTAASLSLADNSGGQVTLAGGTAQFGNVVNINGSTIAGRGTLDITDPTFANTATPWTNAGKVNVAAGGTLTLNTPAPWRSTGTISLADGSSLAGSPVTVAARLEVSGAATLAAPVNFTSGAAVVLSFAVPTTLSLRGAITYGGGTFSNTAGTVRQDADAEVVSSTTIGGERYDWDGASDARATTIQSGVTLSMSARHIQDTGAETFRGTLNINSGTLAVFMPWEMAGTLNLNKLPRPPGAPTDTRVPGIGGSAVTITGTVRATNAASILAAPRLIAPTVVLADAGDSLELGGPAEVRGGSYTGQGLLNFSGDASINSDTTIAANARFARSVTVAAGATLTTGGAVTWETGVLPGGTLVNNGTYAIPAAPKFVSFGVSVVDLDGTTESGRLSVGASSSVYLGVTRIDAADNRFNGTIDVDNTSNGNLKVSVASHLWEMAGTLNLTSVNFPSQPALTGDTVLVSGTVNASGQTEIAAPVRYVDGSTIIVGPTSDTRVGVGSLASDAGQTLIKRGPGELAISGVQSHGFDATLRIDEGRFTLNTDAGSSAVRNLNLRIGAATTSATAYFTKAQHLRSLIVSRGQATELGTRIVTGSLSIDTAAAAQLDLRTAPLVVDYAPDSPTSPLADIRSYLATGYHAGAWDGPGIVSSTARTTPATRTLGYAEAADVLGLSGAQTATFLGETVDATAVLVRLTIPGDANLDGAVNFADLLALARNYNAASAGWSQGDVDYSGSVNFNDLLLLARNYNTAMPAAPIPGAPAEFAADLAAAFTAVPEPSTLALAAVGASGLLSRRRRRATC